jgi:tetratricopeptide (TPR) repeat protein
MQEAKILDGYEWMDPDEVDAKIESLYQDYLSFSEEETNDRDLDVVFELMEGLIFVRDYERLTDVMDDARRRINRRLENDPDDERAMDRLIELNRTTIRFIQSTPDNFAEMPYFIEIVERCEGRGDKFELRKKQALVGLVGQYRKWLEMGGSADDERLAQWSENIEAMAQEYIEQTSGQPEFRIPFRRTLAQFYLQSQKPNEALAQLKAAMEEAPNHPKFAPTDLADFNFEIGAVLSTYKKYEAALKYLNAALDIYREAGPDYEIYAHQTEAWIEECRGK